MRAKVLFPWLAVLLFCLLCSQAGAAQAGQKQSPGAPKAGLAKEAEQDNAATQAELGLMHATGQGAPKDYGRAVYWFRKAAEQGNADGQYNLGVMHANGHGVTQDYGKAAEWYRKAAEQGNRRAQNNLGLMYDEGRGILKDHAEAVKWYRKAAEQGHAIAQYNLGVAYRDGQGVPKDYGKAFAWFRKAAEQGDPDARQNLGLMYEKGLGVARDIGKAAEWYRKAEQARTKKDFHFPGESYEERKFYLNSPWCLYRGAREYQQWSKTWRAMKDAPLWRGANGYPHWREIRERRKGGGEPTPHYFWGALRMGFDATPFTGRLGKRPIVIAVLDTGIDRKIAGLGKTVTDSMDVSGHMYAGYEPKAVNADVLGDSHGTMIAYTLSGRFSGSFPGLVPGARIVDVKISTEKSGQADPRDMAEGITWAVDEAQADIISISFGGPAHSIEKYAVDYALSRGVLVVAAAGNNGGSVEYPAAYPGVIAVGAADINDRLADFSSRGPEIDFVAPGVDIYTRGIGGKEDFVHGTSLAVPYVTAAVAVALEAGAPRDKEGMVNFLKQYCEPLVSVDGHRYPASQVGNGLIRVDRIRMSGVIQPEADTGSMEARAMYNLGSMYASGNGVKKNEARHVQLTEKSARLGYGLAMFSTCMDYRMGTVVEQDYAKAFDWCQKGAEAGNEFAMTQLAHLYHQGKGTGQDNAKAFHWFEKAAEKGYAGAMVVLGDLCFQGKDVPKDMDKAFAWYKKAAENPPDATGYVQGMMGFMYEHGLGVSADAAKAIHWYEEAAKNGYADAQKILQALRGNRPEKQWELTRTNSIGMEFALIPAGSFTGVVNHYNPDRWFYQATVSRPFYLGKYEVTQAQWEAVMGNNPSHFKGPDNPVENVSWDDAQEFIKRLNAREGTTMYRLPTEMEWGLAASASEEGRLDEYAWMNTNSNKTTHPVGRKKPNFHGLYDMYGNVWEWMQDRHGTLPKDVELTDYRGPDEGSGRVLRGGAWNLQSATSRDLRALRVDQYPTHADKAFGFRLAFSLETTDAEAQYMAGNTFYYGQGGVPKDYGKALEAYVKAAEQGHAAAQNSVGWMYDNGLGVTQDYGKAVEWYSKSAEQGYAVAQNNLGWMYQKGLGVAQDYAKAVEWYEKAVAQGNTHAQNELGWMYRNGVGVTQDYGKAVEFYSKAAEQGYAVAQRNLALMYQNGQGVAQDYAKAVEWYGKAAEQGYDLAQNDLGWMYQNGLGVAKNNDKAIEWYQKAAEQGHADARKNLDAMLK